MRSPFYLTAAAAFGIAAILSLLVSISAASRVERAAERDLTLAMSAAGQEWVSVEADGLAVNLGGTAPDEAARFEALRLAARIVDTDRINDTMDVVDPAQIVAPRFSVEMLRNEDVVSLIGLVPEAEDRDSLTLGIADFAEGLHVANMVETARFPVPEHWHDAVVFGLLALSELPRSKVSVFEDRVVVEAVSDSAEEQAEWRALLEANRPEGILLVADISAPRPVITPFTLRFVQEAGVGRFEACSAATEAGRRAIVAAARAGGMAGDIPEEDICRIGLGVPSPNWSRAATASLAAIGQFEDAALTISDADVSLIAAEGTPSDLFDRVVGELEAALPEVFSLHAVLPATLQTGAGEEGPPSFTATRSPEGLVQLRGRLPGGGTSEAIGAYAHALFGRENTYLATRSAEGLPSGWPLRVMAGLEALSLLHNGALVVEPDHLRLTGNSGTESVTSDLSQLLSDHLGAAESFEIDVNYVATLDPIVGLPSERQCIDRLNAALTGRKITFDPGSTRINEATGRILDDLAELMRNCAHVEIEIGGHTDSQGREEMNLGLSQSRAEAVLNGLLARQVLTSNLTARGYGESRPLASNETEEGRETNRRIEFVLVADLADIVAAEEAAIRAAELAEILANAPRPTRRPNDQVPAEMLNEDPAEDETAPEADAPEEETE